MSHLIRSSIVLAVGLAAIGCGGGRAAEQQPAPTATTAGAETPKATVAQPTLPAPTAPSNVSDAEVKAFTDAVIALAMLEQQGEARVESGESVDDVEADLEQQMRSVFASLPITPQRFGEIADQLDSDPALRQRIEAQIERRTAPAV